MVDLSICVTNWNKSDLLPLQFRLIKLTLDECNRHMERRNEPHKKIEVIVVDHESSGYHSWLFDEMTRTFQAVKPLNLSAYRIKNTTQNPNLPFNIAFKRAKGEFTMLLPSDCMPLSGLQKFLDHHKGREIFLKSQLMSLPAFANQDTLKTNCVSVAGGTCKTKYWHEIRGTDERVIGAYTGEQRGVINRMIRDTALTEIICGENIYTLHFDRQVHPEAVRNVDLKEANEKRQFYSKQEWETPVNPDRWGECETLEKIL